MSDNLLSGGVDEYGRSYAPVSPPVPARNILDAAREGWNSTDFWTPEGRAWLETLHPAVRVALGLPTGLVSSALGAGNALFRGAQQAVVEGGNALDQAGVPQIPGTGTWSQAGRDIASIPEAFGGSPGQFHGQVPSVADVAPQVRAAVPAVVDATKAVLADERGMLRMPDGSWKRTGGLTPSEVSEPGPMPKEGAPATELERLIQQGRTSDFQQLAQRGRESDFQRLVNAPGADERVSTRVPSSVEALKQGDPHTTAEFEINHPANQAATEAYDKNLAKVRLYPDLRAAGLSDSDAVAETFMRDGAAKLGTLHDAMLADPRIGQAGLDRAKLWYDGGNRIVHDWAKEHGLEPRQVAAVIASLSPQTDWYQNVSRADRIMTIARNKMGTMADDGMRAWMTEYIAGKEKELQKDIAKKGPDYDPTDRLQNIANTRRHADIAGRGRLMDMDNENARAMWVRAWDQANNPRGFRIVTPEGGFLGPQLTDKGVPERIGWGGMIDIKKAMAAIDSPDLAHLSANALGKNHKVRSFFNNLIAPNAPFGDVTIDTHAINAAHWVPMGGEHPVVQMGLGTSGAGAASTGTKGLYGMYADLYRSVAAHYGMLPRQLQSITWEGVRGLFSPEQKRSAAFMKANAGIWAAYRSGQLTLDQAMRRVLIHSGGIDPPSWLK